MRFASRHSLSLAALIVALAVALPSRGAFGQVTEATLLNHLQEAKQKGVNLPPEEIQRILTRFRERQKKLREIEEESLVKLGGTPGAESPSQNIHKPLSRVMGRDGIAFPKPEEVLLKPSPTSAPTEFDTPTPAPLWSPTPYPPPRKCESNGIKREIIYEDADDSEIMRDKLFLPEDLVPLDPDEVFGTHVTLEPYGPALDEATLQTMELFKVPCVPYRVRRTARTQYYLFGDHALRRYTGNPTGKEKPHPFIQQKLNSSYAPRR